MLFSREDLVELDFISSNISRYAEFRAVDRIITYVNNKRADVFTDKDVTVLEIHTNYNIFHLFPDRVQYSYRIDHYAKNREALEAVWNS